ncbi:hypothetical protein Apa02nite_098930 [Actinoplanes palleronii]|uniref:Uncharacterized protein n=1 Tax=Actinoplanes palleronii TaxID=113570 RepID=A0ABQ4BT16_9ACTN|nr:hypothetical protein Apa02nite_098930 [Actinoplanes palleronii]
MAGLDYALRVIADYTFFSLFFVLLIWGIGLFITYWIIRLAVRHALQDSDLRRARQRPPGY